MGSAEIAAFGGVIVTIVFGVIGYLLSHKDSAQEKMIEELFKKCDENENKINVFQLDVAKFHYEKPEINEIVRGIKSDFDGLKEELHTGFGVLGTKFDSLSKALLDHIHYEDKRSDERRKQQ